MADLNDPTLNVNIANDDNTKLVSVITDGPTERLAVDAKLSNTPTVALPEFTPQFNYSTANTALSDVSYTTLFNLTGTKGKVAFINLVCSRSDYTVRLTVDGTIRLTIAATDLGSTLGLTTSVGTSIPIYTAIANKNFIYNPLVPVDFADGFKLEAIKTTVQATTMNWMITYRTRL